MEFWHIPFVGALRAWDSIAGASGSWQALSIFLGACWMRVGSSRQRSRLDTGHNYKSRSIKNYWDEMNGFSNPKKRVSSWQSGHPRKCEQCHSQYFSVQSSNRSWWHVVTPMSIAAYRSIDFWGLGEMPCTMSHASIPAEQRTLPPDRAHAHMLGHNAKLMQQHAEGTLRYAKIVDLIMSNHFKKSKLKEAKYCQRSNSCFNLTDPIPADSDLKKNLKVPKTEHLGASWWHDEDLVRLSVGIEEVCLGELVSRVSLMALMPPRI